VTDQPALTPTPVGGDGDPPPEMVTRVMVDCPRATSLMTPCVARDGDRVLNHLGQCVHCGEHPANLLAKLAREYVDLRVQLEPGAALEQVLQIAAVFLDRAGGDVVVSAADLARVDGTFTRTELPDGSLRFQFSPIGANGDPRG
jgi:hypothetical protein